MLSVGAPSEVYGQRNNSKCVLLAIAGFLVLCIAVAVPILVFTVQAKSELQKERKETLVDKIITMLMQDTLNVALPTRYLVPSNYIIPPSDQGNRGTCWGFAGMNLLEAQYKAQGIKYGFLKPDEYVEFSPQAYVKWLGEKCMEHQEVAPCQHGGYGNNVTSDHKLDAIYYFSKDFPELRHSVLPNAVCPYQIDESEQWVCDGMLDALKTNPIEWTVKSIKASGEIEGAKRLLVEAGRPIGIGVPINSVRYWAPCDASNWSTHEECTSQSTKCPAGYQSEFCHEVIVDNRIRDGTFTYVDDLTQTVPAGGHAMNIVGYNDDWVYRVHKGSERGIAKLKGGFILHNTWRAPGHSVDYLLGRISEENEAVQCPNYLSPMNWIPTTAECIITNKGDITKCGTYPTRVRGKGLTKHADVLACKSADLCDTSRKYALGSLNDDTDVQPLFSGLDRVHVVSWTGDGSDAVDEYYDSYPFWAFRTVFEPENTTEYENMKDLCGYWMYPYDAMTQANRAKVSLFDTFHATDIEFEFTNSSYAANPDLRFDYTLLQKSTRTVTKMEFDGPLPYKYVY